MERRLKLLAALVPLLLILSTFAFAQTENLFPNGIGQGSYKGVKLVAVTQTGPQVAGPLQEYRALWEKKTGGTVEVQTFPFGDLFQKIRTAFVSGANPFDLLVYASDWAGDIMGSGYAIEVPQKIQDQMGYKTLIPAYRERILSWGGKIYGLPYDGDAHMMYYRRDLLTDSKYQGDFKAKYGYDMPVPPTDLAAVPRRGRVLQRHDHRRADHLRCRHRLQASRPVVLDLPRHRGVVRQGAGESGLLLRSHHHEAAHQQSGIRARRSTCIRHWSRWARRTWSTGTWATSAPTSPPARSCWASTGAMSGRLHRTRTPRW